MERRETNNGDRRDEREVWEMVEGSPLQGRLASMATQQLQVGLFLLFLFVGDTVGNPLPGGDGTALDPTLVYEGGWELVCSNSGVSVMHMAVTHTNKAILFDATNFGPSNISLPDGGCRPVPGKNGTLDCWAHAVEYDIDTGSIRPLKVLTNTWCSSGGFSTNGTLVQTGGWNEGTRAVRYLPICDDCNWKEYATALSRPRWYATQQKLPDGGFILIGGRRGFGYEFVPAEGKFNADEYKLPLLQETTDEVEDNLYPFLHLSPDGNVFVFANNRSILLDYKSNRIVREFPQLQGGSRNYPASAMSALLPLNLRRPKKLRAEVIVCGGSPPLSAKLAGNGTFLPALRTCGRITITNPASKWRVELMPTGRVTGDMLLLPNAELLLINGASRGAAGWGFARDPVLSPVLYSPGLPRARRFRVLAPSTIPRVYHSSSAVLPDGRILVAGSNTNSGYNFTDVMFPTELRLEKFSPPYLDPLLAAARPEITAGGAPERLTYGQTFTLDFAMVGLLLAKSDVKVTMYAPPFTTHGFSMGQRLLVLRVTDVVLGLGTFQVKVVAPPSAVIAPPGYYMLFVVHQNVPSKAVWVHIQ